MHPYPHTYRMTAAGTAAGAVSVTGEGLASIATQPPPEFDGPGGFWSPESLLVAAVADCFMLSFRALTRASRFEWQSLDCQTEGVLDRVAGVAQFTRFRTVATLRVAAGTDTAKARQLLERAEHICLIANSLKATRELELSVVESPAGA